MLEHSSSVPRLHNLKKSIAAFLALIALLRAAAPLIAAGTPWPEPPSAQEIAQEIAPLIGGGDVIANVTSAAGSGDFECDYEHARNPDGSRSMNTASLSVTHYEDPAQPKSTFDGYVKSSVDGLLDTPPIGAAPILRLEQGRTYTAFSDGSVARVVHGTTLVTLAVVDVSRPRSRSATYLQWSDQIRRLAFAPQAPPRNPMPGLVLRPGYPKNLPIGWPGIFWTISSGRQRMPFLWALVWVSRSCWWAFK